MNPHIVWFVRIEGANPVLRSAHQPLSPVERLRADDVARRLWPGLVPIPKWTGRLATP